MISLRSLRLCGECKSQFTAEPQKQGVFAEEINNGINPFWVEVSVSYETPVHNSSNRMLHDE